MSASRPMVPPWPGSIEPQMLQLDQCGRHLLQCTGETAWLYHSIGTSHIGMVPASWYLLTLCSLPATMRSMMLAGLPDLSACSLSICFSAARPHQWAGAFLSH